MNGGEILDAVRASAAEALAIPAGTVMSRLHAARQALAAAYGKD